MIMFKVLIMEKLKYFKWIYIIYIYIFFLDL